MDGSSGYLLTALYATGSLLLLLLLAGGFLLRHGISDSARLRELEQRLRTAELREKQYSALEQYVERTRSLRHDFQHAVCTIGELAEEGDLEELRSFIREYTKLQPRGEAVCRFCEHPAANAIFSYYARAAAEQGIRIRWQTEVPRNIPVSDVDLTVIFGNILDNAVRACAAVPPGERYINLRADMNTPGALYISAANSFDGKPVIRNGRFFTTKKDGGGLGLRSVAETAGKYGGASRFTCRGREFQSSVLLRLSGGSAGNA